MRHTGRSVVSVYKLLSTICTPLTRCASSPCLPLSSPFAPRWAISLAVWCSASSVWLLRSDPGTARCDPDPARARVSSPKRGAEGGLICVSWGGEEGWTCDATFRSSSRSLEIVCKKGGMGFLGCVCVEVVHCNRWCNCNFTFKSQQASQIMEGSSKFHHKQSGDRSRFEILTF